MTAASFLRDITAFSIQIALVGLGIAILLKLVKLPAGIRYTGLRLALVASLVVPWLLRTPDVQAPALAALSPAAVVQTAFPAADVATASSAGATALAATESRSMVAWVQIGFGALLIGIAARVAWLGMGVLRLLRLKREGVVVDAPEYSALQQQLGTRATIAQVAALPQPATFGVRRPIVLLPGTLADASPSLRRAVVAHELFHVRRRDWLSVLAEEAVRTALWFHPAILWMTSQIQLAREEIVDELTVQATGDRRTYVEALLAFADTPGLSPAPAFAHRRQLFHRILSVSKENVMSTPRIVSSAAVLLTAVLGSSWYASTLFPIVKAAKADVQASASSAIGDSAPAQSDSRVVLAGNVVVRTGDMTLRTARLELAQQRGNVVAARPTSPVTPENPIPRRTRGVAPVRPSRFPDVHVVISPLVTLDRNGTVMSVAPDACSVAGAPNSSREDVCDAFFEPTAAAIRQWRYDRPVQGPIKFYVHIRFQPGAAPTITQSGESYKEYVRDTQERLRVATEASKVEEERYLRERVAQLMAQSRELERAHRLAVERLSPAHPDLITLQQQLARLNDDMARVEEQLRSSRSQLSSDDERVRRENDMQVVLRRQLQEVERQLAASQRQLEQAKPSNDEQIRAAEERLRAAQRQLEAAQRSSAADGSRQLVSPSGRTPLRVSPPVVAPVAIRKVNPQHSTEAMRARAEGTVTLEALVDEQGRVADARVLKSIPLLDQSALDAAKQWEFKPATLNSEAVPVLIQLELNFTLK